MNNIEFIETEVTIRCSCGKELVYDKDSESTSPYKCPDEKCWIIVDSKGETWVGKPQ